MIVARTHVCHKTSVRKSKKTHTSPPDVIALVTALKVLAAENTELKQRKTSPLPESTPKTIDIEATIDKGIKDAFATYSRNEPAPTLPTSQWNNPNPNVGWGSNSNNICGWGQNYTPPVNRFPPVSNYQHPPHFDSYSSGTGGYHTHFAKRKTKYQEDERKPAAKPSGIDSLIGSEVSHSKRKSDSSNCSNSQSTQSKKCTTTSLSTKSQNMNIDRTKSSIDRDINFNEIDSALQTQRGLKSNSHYQFSGKSSNTKNKSRSKERMKIKRGHKRWNQKNKILELELKVK